MEYAIHEKDPQLKYLTGRLQTFLEVIDELKPESINVDDIDRLLQIIDEMEATLKHE